MNLSTLRNDFPNLKVKIKGKDLVYFDNAATTFKPQEVIDAVCNHYTNETSNVHRAVHTLSVIATEKYDGTRETIKKFIGANDEREIVFTKGTTNSINLVAYGLRESLTKNDEIIITEMEHHSNLVPWQLLAQRTGAKLNFVHIDDNGELDLNEYEKLLNKNTKIVSVVHISNSIGTINPIKEIIDTAHKHGAKVLIDGAQAAAHIPIDVKKLDCDFYCFSGHKMHGPTGVGVLYGRYDVLSELPPFEGGGDMIEQVTLEKTTFKGIPGRFEAGTPNIAGVIGLDAATKYIMKVGKENIMANDEKLLKYATKELEKIDGLMIIGTSKNKGPIVSIHFDNVHAHDIGTLADEDGIAMRAGHHCTQPIMNKFGIAATTRASFALYNNKEEIDKLVISLNRIQKIFK